MRSRPTSTRRPGLLRQTATKLTAAAVNPLPIDRDRALARMERWDAMTMLMSSLEHLARPQERVHGGFNDWTVAKRNLHQVSPRYAKVVDAIAPPKVTAALHAGRVAAALALLAPTSRRTRTIADLSLLGSTTLLHPRSLYGTDGTDQVAYLVTANASFARLARHPALVDSALWAVALQATISYAASGWVKVTSETWRSGRALTGVTRTQTYGDEAAYRLLSWNPRATQAIAASVLAMESLFPLLYLKGGKYAHPWLLTTLLFHLGNARIMGLGRFVWAFGSMHPAVLYTADARCKPTRDDTLPRTVGVMAGVVAAAGAVQQLKRRKRAQALAPTEQVLPTRLGNELAYERHGADDGTGPVFVLEGGLLSSPMLWSYLVRALSEDHLCVTYGRAGYGASTYHQTTDFTLEQSVDDLVDLIDAVSDGGRREVVLIGHSLGGWLAAKAAERAPQLVSALGLVDSSHPAELQRSSRQAEGEKLVTKNIRLVIPSLAAGLGWLMVKPDFRLPKGAHERYLDQWNDPALWRAGLREWRAVQREFWAFDGTLPTLEQPVLVLSAEQTEKLDTTQRELHDELAAMSPTGRQLTIARTDHESIIVDATVADEVAGHLRSLLSTSDASPIEEPEHAR